MLQRAASNAYSWWAASHIRTKQSKWLDQNLQDMEEKVQSMLKLIQEDGDSFAKRAEMYYKRRPELINFVEESYKAYRSLAERYDHLSKELQNANNTIASVFPEQVQFAMEEEDDYGSPRVPKNIIPKASTSSNVPKVPKLPSRDLKGLLTSASKQLQANKLPRPSKTSKAPPKLSGLNKSEALEEIDKLQKEILALQTVKEFVKSSYESGLTKYREIESRITELQEKVFNLQDEFSVGKVIEDDEARSLMVETALKSCDEALSQLQEKQDRSTMEARAEFKRVEHVREQLKSLTNKLLPDHQQADHEEKPNHKAQPMKARETLQGLLNLEEAGGVAEENQELNALRVKIKDHLEVSSKESLTMTELAEKIDELVSKVISLETSVSSQTALIDRLKTETDDLQTQVQTLEDDKASLVDGAHNLTKRLREMQEKYKGLEDLNQIVENQDNSLRANFTEACCNLDHLSEKLLSVKPYEEFGSTESLQDEKEEKEPFAEVKTPADARKQENIPIPGELAAAVRSTDEQVFSIILDNQGEKEKEEEKVSQIRPNTDAEKIPGKREDPKEPENVVKHEVHQTAEHVAYTELQEVTKERDEEPSWQQMLMNGLEDREKILLSEYTAILRNYKDVKMKLSDVEKKNRDSVFETTVQIREMKGAIAKRDEEILSLRKKLNLLGESFDENKDSKENNASSSIPVDNKKAKPEGTDHSQVNGALEVPLIKNDEEDAKLILIDQPQFVSPTEEKLRMNIDALLDENLDFWLRFSTSFHQVQKFKTGFQDLQAEISKLKEKENSNQEGNDTSDIKSELRPIYKHLREIQTELTVWIEQRGMLKEELQRRFSSLCNIQDEITTALNAGAEEEEMKFTSHDAAKYQGEVLNMKQENNKVRDELQAGFDHVTTLRHEIEKTLAKLDDEFGLSGSKNNSQSQLRHSTSRSRVPLRSFIFGTKPKKKTSIFSCMNHRKYQELKAGLPLL